MLKRPPHLAPPEGNDVGVGEDARMRQDLNEAIRTPQDPDEAARTLDEAARRPDEAASMQDEAARTPDEAARTRQDTLGTNVGDQHVGMHLSTA